MFTRRAVSRLKADESAAFTRVAGASSSRRRKDASGTPEFPEALVNSYSDTDECAAVYARAAGALNV